MFSSICASFVLATSQLADPAAAFGAQPLLSGVQISPDGRNYAARVSTESGSGLGVFTTEGGFRYLHFLEDNAAKKVSDFFWKSDDRLVFSARMPAVRAGTPTVETRLFSFSLAEGEMIPLFSRARPRGMASVQIQDDFVSILPDDPDNILVQYTPRNRQGKGVYRVRVDRDTRHILVQDPHYKSLDWQADHGGSIRGMLGLSRGETSMNLRVRDSEGEWRDISHRAAEDAPSFSVVGFPKEPGKAYVASAHEGDTQALYLYDAGTDSFEQKLFEHEGSDVYGIRQDPKTWELVGVYFGEESSVVRWFGEGRPEKTIAALTKAMGYTNLSFVRFNASGSDAILYTWEDLRPGRYLSFAYDSGEVTELPPQYPSLEGVKLGSVVAVDYQARDGLSIPAYVTLPPSIDGLEEARNLPFVVLPHGGPTARDFLEFDWLSQFLAHQGFGVLQMNFRGSAGYGETFRAAGDRQWGQAMQDDITDGTRWLFENGLADPDRTSILGASYGGYAALMGAVKTPDLFRCAVSINGVSDLPTVIADERDYIGGTYGTRHIGRLWGDRKMLAENSPARRADEITAPVLLIAGEEDRVVPPEHSERMRRAMERAGKSVELVTLEEGSHRLDVGNNRVLALRAIDRFLAGCR